MLLKAQSELARTQQEIVVSQTGTLIGRSAPAPGKLPTGWVQVSGKHCRIYYDTSAVRCEWTPAERTVILSLLLFTGGTASAPMVQRTPWMLW